MNKETFMKMMTSMITMKRLSVPDGYLKDLYGLLKDDFTDDEFQYACENILKGEVLYNKSPDPQLFYKYRDKVRPSDDDKLMIEKQSFLQKVAGYLSENFVSTTERDEFIKGFTALEKKALMSAGGISALWSSVHSEGGYPRTISSIQKELGQFFEDNYRIGVVEGPQLENRGGGLRQIGGMS